MQYIYIESGAYTFLYKYMQTQNDFVWDKIPDSFPTMYWSTQRESETNRGIND